MMYAFAPAAVKQKDDKDAYVPESECSTCHGKVYRHETRKDAPKMTNCFCHRQPDSEQPIIKEARDRQAA